MAIIGTSLPHSTLIVPTHSNGRAGQKVRAIVIHHQASNLAGKQIAQVFRSRRSSATYSIATDGTITQHVSEADRPWTTSGANPDNHAITIEVANNSFAPNWTVSDAALNATISLCADICKRYGITRLYYNGKNGTLLRHCDYSATACPGPYIKARTAYICAEVNAKLANANNTATAKETASASAKYRVQCGVFSSKENADALSKKLTAAGFANAVVEVK
ncbi:N-acetylmuramoyl-L-alanine amidase [Galactobacillus timonensis]|uniref:N-acetylmuramoyl-L-alanine amidase n=1 Tax=Galactobacillus timonensis TaxID=2041840 RepID=UPI000C81A1CF|nr:N-acetylmuramoyl-L-alanine amidase [Galactobacillus timonensis]